MSGARVYAFPGVTLPSEPVRSPDFFDDVRPEIEQSITDAVSVLEHAETEAGWLAAARALADALHAAARLIRDLGD